MLRWSRSVARKGVGMKLLRVLVGFGFVVAGVLSTVGSVGKGAPQRRFRENPCNLDWRRAVATNLKSVHWIERTCT